MILKDYTTLVLGINNLYNTARYSWSFSVKFKVSNLLYTAGTNKSVAILQIPSTFELFATNQYYININLYDINGNLKN